MSYAIIRNENYKIGQLSYIYRHNERKNTNYSNKDINKNSKIKNYSIKSINTSYQKAFNILKEKYNLKGQIKKVSNVMCELIITSDKDFFEKIGPEETKRYFQTAYKFVAGYQNLGEEFIVSAKVHNDESTPHMHLTFVPVVHTKDKNGNEINKIACSEYWKGKDSYKRLQDNFYAYITKAGFDLERGNTKENTHIPIETLKKITNYENIKYEIENNEKTDSLDITKNELETKNLSLVVAQNKALIEYNKKLKINLAKTYTAIQKVATLQTENTNLRQENNELTQENINLREENSKLKSYIQHTFEVVKALFDFPIDRLKRLVDNFVKSLNCK